MNAAVYARVSGSRQEQEQTIDSQLDALRAFVRQQGWNLEEQHVYTDNGVSGARLDRPGLDLLRDAASDGRIDVVVFTDPDRLARKYVHQWVILDELQKTGVQVRFMNRPVGQSAEDQLLLHVQGAIAEYERAKILERTRRGRLYRARLGEMLNWSMAPFGYRYVRRMDRRAGYAQVEDSEAHWVRTIFDWYLREHIGTPTIARRLTQAGVRPRRAGHWHASSVRNILSNPLYAGRTYYNRTEAIREMVSGGPGRPDRQVCRVRVRPMDEWIELRVPPIIDEESLRRAQERLRNGRTTSRRRTRPGICLLRGLVFCGTCGHRMKGYFNRPHVYYACPRQANPWDTASLQPCTEPKVRSDFVDAFVWDHLKTLLLQPAVLETQLDLQRQQGAPNTPTYERQLQRLNKETSAQQHRQVRLLELYEDGLLEKEAYRQRSEVLRAKIEAIQREAEDLEAQSRQWQHTARMLEGIETFRAAVRQGIERASFEDRQQICRLVVERVEVRGEELSIKHILPVTANTAQ